MEKIQQYLITGLIGGIVAVAGGLYFWSFIPTEWGLSLGALIAGSLAIVGALAGLATRRGFLIYLIAIGATIIIPVFIGSLAAQSSASSISQIAQITGSISPVSISPVPLILELTGCIAMWIAVLGHSFEAQREKKEAVKRVDDKVLKYIIEHKWEISKPQAAKDLDLSTDELDASIERLTMAGKLERE